MQRLRHSKRRTPNQPVGTQAEALENLRRNKSQFGYPEANFVSPIEYTLIYAMISKPNVYPPEVVIEAIENENFVQYMEVVTPKEEEPITSYAQLTAILALAAEHWPSGTDDDESAGVAQVLCKTLLRIVVKHAQEHDLDRETEVNELLQPLQRLATKQDDQTALALLVPTYIGLAGTMLSANPLPLYIGYTVGNALVLKGAAKHDRQQVNVRSLTKTSNRVANAETTSLLDEVQE